MEKRWRIRPHDPAVIARLEQATGVSSVVARLLAARGLTVVNEIKAFLDAKLTSLSDPEDLPGVSQAADRIHQAITSQRRIIIYGDYDADGMSATAILFRCLQLVHANVSYYVPNRMSDGYGLNCQALRKLASDGASMIITVDCGISSTNEARTARELGLELIITDHHQLGEELPDAAAIVHPQLAGQIYPHPYLCGAGVAFKLAWAICQRMSDARKVTTVLRDFLLSALGLAAIGTVADVVPLIGENRVLVKHGLASLKANSTPGIRELARVAQLDQRNDWSSEDIAFSLAPRLNAAGRLGQAQLGVELLATENNERAKALADYLEGLNSDRLHLERSVHLAASKQVKERFDPQTQSALVLAERGWHQGVIGIVAGKIAEKFHRPVIIIALDELGNNPSTGSARSVPGLDINRALGDCRQFLLRHGGHAAAAGLQIREEHVDSFREHFCQAVEQLLGDTPQVAEIVIDAETSLAELTVKSIHDIQLLAPFGQSNPRPTLCATGVRLAEPPRYMGQGERHLQVTLEQHGTRFRAIAFNRGEWLPELTAISDTVDIAFRPTINNFRGRQTVELQLADWRVSKTSQQPVTS